MNDSGPHPVILYDGVCGLCNGFTRFTLRWDRRAHFRFAALQSEYARRALTSHGRNPDDLDTLYVIVPAPGGPRLLTRARAGLFILSELGWPWRAATALGVLPTRLLDALYDQLATRRYRIFGQLDTCPVPTPQVRARFLDHQLP